jgi:adenylate cyclase
MKSIARTVTPRTIIAACTIGLPAIVLLLGMLVAQQTIENNAANHAVFHTSAVRMRLQRVFSMLQDAETGQRGYLLTDQEKYLKPYTAASAQVGPEISKLADLLRADPAQRARVERLRIVASRKMTELGQTIELYRGGNHGAAAVLVSKGDGFAMMEEGRKITSDILAVQTRERAIQMARSAAGYNRTFWFGSVLLSALALLIAFSAIMAFINYREGEKVIADIAR